MKWNADIHKRYKIKKINTYAIILLLLIGINYSVLFSSGMDNKLFDEDWETGEINGEIWKKFGAPEPTLRNNGHGGSVYSLDTNGDSDKYSGVVTLDRFSLLNLSVSFYAKYEAIGGEASNNFEIAITKDDPAGIIENGYSTIIGIEVSYGNDSGNQFIKYHINVDGENDSDALVDNNWYHYQFEVNQDKTVSFFIDDVLKYTSYGAIDTNNDGSLIISGDSQLNYHHYIDNIHIENLGYPIASFTYSPSSPSTQDTIEFTDTSYDSDDNIINRTWDFGDGNISYELNPNHQFITADTYSVSLTVRDEDGNTDSYSTDISISDFSMPPTAKFTYSADLSSDEFKIDFTDTSTDNGDIVNWTWTFGDGNTSYSQNPFHTYENEGTYEVTLTVRDNDGENDTFAVSIKIDGTSPTVTSAKPSNSASTSENIVIEFSESMDTSSVEQAFSISPSVYNLDWSWTNDNTIATITHNSFKYSTEYTCTIGTGAKDNSIYANNLESSYSWKFSTGTQPICIDFVIKDSSGNKLNPNVYVDDDYKGKASYGVFELCLLPGTYIVSFELDDYPTISKSVTFQSGGSTTVDILMSKVNYSQNSNQMGFDFDLSDMNIPIYGEFSIPISITPINRFNPGQTYDVSIGYTPKSFSISGEVPSFITQFSSVMDIGGTIIDYATDGLFDLKGDTISDTLIDNPVGIDPVEIYNKSYNLLSEVEFDFKLWFDINGDIIGQIVHEGPLNVSDIPISFTDYKFSIKIDEDAEPGGEVKIGIIPSYEASFRFLGRLQLLFAGYSSYLFDSYDSGQKQFYPKSGWTDAISIPSSATIGFVGIINYPPVANFTFPDYPMTTLSKISFVDNSSDYDGTISKWLWNFGNNENSNQQNPVYSYPSHGSYDVQLTVEDDNGATHSFSKSITIDRSPIEILSHTELSSVEGTITLSGKTYSTGNLSSSIKRVEVRIDDNTNWETVDGTDNWNYVINAKDLENGIHTIHIRCTDGNQYSEVLSFNLNVNNQAVSPFGISFQPRLDNPLFLFIIILIIAIALGIIAKIAVSRKKKKPARDVIDKDIPPFSEPVRVAGMEPVSQSQDKPFYPGVTAAGVSAADATDTEINKINENTDEQVVKNMDDLNAQKTIEEKTLDLDNESTFNYCLNCGKAIEGKQNFCNNCGHKIK